MLVVNIAATLSVVLIFLQILRKVSLSHPVAVGLGIVLLPVWAGYTFYFILNQFVSFMGEFSDTQGDQIHDWLSYSAATFGTAVLRLFFVSIPYLLFLVIAIKANLFPCKSIHNCPDGAQEAAGQIACTRLCWYALAMLVLYLGITFFCIVKSFDGLIIGATGLGFIDSWGTLGVLVCFFINPLAGLLALGWLAAINAIFLIPLVVAGSLLGLMLTIALVTGLNATIRTCRFTGRKVVGLTLLALLPVVNSCILIYLLVRLKNNAAAVSGVNGS